MFRFVSLNEKKKSPPKMTKKMKAKVKAGKAASRSDRREYMQAKTSYKYGSPSSGMFYVSDSDRKEYGGDSVSRAAVARLMAAKYYEKNKCDRTRGKSFDEKDACAQAGAVLYGPEMVSTTRYETRQLGLTGNDKFQKEYKKYFNTSLRGKKVPKQDLKDKRMATRVQNMTVGGDVMSKRLQGGLEDRMKKSMIGAPRGKKYQGTAEGPGTSRINPKSSTPLGGQAFVDSTPASIARGMDWDGGGRPPSSGGRAKARRTGSRKKRGGTRRRKAS